MNENEKYFTFWETNCVAHSTIIHRIYVISATFINKPCHNSIEIYQIFRHISIDLLILHTDFALKIAVYCVYDKATIFLCVFYFYSFISHVICIVKNLIGSYNSINIELIRLIGRYSCDFLNWNEQKTKSVKEKNYY